MHFMLLIRTVPFIRLVLNYPDFPLEIAVGPVTTEGKNTLLKEGLAAKSAKSWGNGSFLSRC